MNPLWLQELGPAFHWDKSLVHPPAQAQLVVLQHHVPVAPQGCLKLIYHPTRHSMGLVAERANVSNLVQGPL